jgi:1-acyl-sn-glycerol-3-phosphate acyltransferase
MVCGSSAAGTTARALHPSILPPPYVDTCSSTAQAEVLVTHSKVWRPRLRSDNGAQPLPVSSQRAVEPPPLALAPLSPRESRLCNGISPWLSPLAMVVTQDLALRAFFSAVTVLGRDQLPLSGPVLLAPTHRARWDALLLPHAAGRRVTGRDCRFMVTIDEMVGVQGWLLHRLGCFPVDQGRPTMASLRLAIDLLSRGQQLVVFPEGRIQRLDGPIHLHQGLARLSQLAEGQGVSVAVVPVGIAYSHAMPRFGDRASVCFGPPLHTAGQGREAARAFTADLATAMGSAEQAARAAVGRPLAAP